MKIIKIQDVVKEALAFLRASIPTTIDIRQDIHPDCGPILADPTQIHQIIMNLCTNAYHAMRETGGVMRIVLSQAEVVKIPPETGSPSRPGAFVLLEVSDTGTGISPESLEKIFDPYYTTKAKGEGTGMGLSVVHGIVKSHGGEIAVESTLGKGTTFRIYFPVAKEYPMHRQDNGAIHAAPRGHEHILVVDDETVVADINQKTLESLGYQVSAFTNSEKALDAFCARPEGYDLILTDMTMPRLNGLQLSEKIRAVKPGMPIILCTGYSDLISEEKIRTAGIRKLVMKPVFRKDLAAAIRIVLDNPA